MTDDDKTVVLGGDPPPEARLVCVNDADIDDVSGTIEFDLSGPGPFTIGRDVSNDVQINSRKLSRKHAQIAFENDSWVLQDLASTNGTFLNATLTTGKVRLHPADEIAFSTVSFRFEIPRSIQRDDETDDNTKQFTTLPMEEDRSASPHPTAEPPPAPSLQRPDDIEPGAAPSPNYS